MLLHASSVFLSRCKCQIPCEHIHFDPFCISFSWTMLCTRRRTRTVKHHKLDEIMMKIIIKSRSYQCTTGFAIRFIAIFFMTHKPYTTLQQIIYRNENVLVEICTSLLNAWHGIALWLSSMEKRETKILRFRFDFFQYSSNMYRASFFIRNSHRIHIDKSKQFNIRLNFSHQLFND